MHILEVLSEKVYISGNEIGERLGISRAAVHKQIKTLKNKGYIVHSSSKGYKLIKSSDMINANDILSKLNPDTSVCTVIKHYNSIESTQLKLKLLAETGSPEGTVVFADEQSGAYGRMKRKWSSEKGGLWFSMLLKPHIRPDETPKIALLISIALRRILLNSYGIKTNIKWPNDILYNDKKMCGIIIEMSAEQDIVNWVAAGIGVNINNPIPKQLKTETTVLKDILGKKVNLSAFTVFFFNEFQKIYDEFQNSGFSRFVEEFNQNTAYKGLDIKIYDGYDIISGINEGINENGHLKIRTGNNIKNIISGTLRRN